MECTSLSETLPTCIYLTSQSETHAYVYCYRMYSEAINCIAKRPQSQGCSFQQILTHYGSYVAAELSLPLNQCTGKPRLVKYNVIAGKPNIFKHVDCSANVKLYNELIKVNLFVIGVLSPKTKMSSIIIICFLCYCFLCISLSP